MAFLKHKFFSKEHEVELNNSRCTRPSIIDINAKNLSIFLIDKMLTLLDVVQDLIEILRNSY